MPTWAVKYINTGCMRHHKLNTFKCFTSDHGVVYHLKQGLSKQVSSSTGRLLLSHSSTSLIWTFPLVMLTHSTVLLFTPRPHVVLHWEAEDNDYWTNIHKLYIFQTYRCHLHPLPVLGQPVWRAFVVSAGMNSQRFVLRWALGLRYYSALWCFAVHMPHCFSVPTDAWTLSRNGRRTFLKFETWNVLPLILLWQSLYKKCFILCPNQLQQCILMFVSTMKCKA